VKDALERSVLELGGQPVFPGKGDSMFYVILIVVAVIIAGALYFVRGRGRAA
jgi:hypothetical protein